ncbi:hypothetical protein [uncultured Bacteroides sp.]|uniref:hypothetical protein n=1 Tax=uncultured Bacteroides sp. TaxID=162156 RepID=UPI0026332050|nr:hypothetical protein [uncultured Bacteroides sp.]
MRKFKSLFSACMAVLMAASFTACSDDPNDGPGGNPGGDSGETTQNYHFDLFMSVGKHGGMSQGDGTIVRSVSSLGADAEKISIEGIGSEFESDGNTYTMEAIVKGKYYYEVPYQPADRFVKLEVNYDPATGKNALNVVAQRPFADGCTFKARSYTHAWLNDNTLLIMAANGDTDKIIWTKLNADNMTIEGSGTVEGISAPEGYPVLTTSGILTYRQSDGKLYYFYFAKTSKRNGKATPYFYTAVIDPTTMKVESNEPNNIAEQMAGSAYGELMQNCVMYDEADNLYLAAFSPDANGKEIGSLLRINKGETKFDASYEGYPNADGKLLTLQYLGNGKALAYARDDNGDPQDGTQNISSYCHYYTIINLADGSRERLKYNGEEIPYSAGRFSQRTAVVDGKAYIGVNTREQSCIYVYDIATGKVEKGAEVDDSFYFDILRVISND